MSRHLAKFKVEFENDEGKSENAWFNTLQEADAFAYNRLRNFMAAQVFERLDDRTWRLV